MDSLGCQFHLMVVLYHFRNNVHVEFIAQINWVDVVALQLALELGGGSTSRSLYMIVKKTCINRLTAFTITLKRYNHASPGRVLVFPCNLKRAIHTCHCRLWEVEGI